jgi:hypothetical protein
MLVRSGRPINTKRGPYSDFQQLARVYFPHGGVEADLETVAVLSSCISPYNGLRRLTSERNPPICSQFYTPRSGPCISNRRCQDGTKR